MKDRRTAILGGFKAQRQGSLSDALPELQMEGLDRLVIEQVQRRSHAFKRRC